MRSAFALRIVSGKIIYNFAFVALCGALQTHFHERSRNGQLHLQRCRITPSVIACGDATFPKGTAFGGSGKVSGIAQRRPLGGAGERSEPEGVAFGITVQFPAKVQSLWARQRLPPRGSWQNRQVLTEGVFATKPAAARFVCSSRSVFYLEVILPKWLFSSSSFLGSGFSAGVRRTSVTRRLAVRVTTPS